MVRSLFPVSLVTSSDISVSLLSLVVTACGLALFGVSLFVSWKLCWIPWRERGLSPTTKEAQGHLNPTMSPLPSQPAPRQPVYTAVDPPIHNRRESSHCSIAREPTPVASVVSVEAPVTPVSPTPLVMATPEAAMKISHTSPDIPLDAQSKSRENGVHTNPRMQRQTTEPPPTGHSMSEIGSVYTVTNIEKLPSNSCLHSCLISTPLHGSQHHCQTKTSILDDSAKFKCFFTLFLSTVSLHGN